MKQEDINNITGEWKCVLCKEFTRGWGNNPSPLSSEGMCCDKCNIDKVVPARIGRLIN